MTASTPRRARSLHPATVIAVAGLVTSAALTPPAASRWFALGDLLDVEARTLWCLAVALATLTAAAFAASRWKRFHGPIVLLFPVLMLVHGELFTRLVVLRTLPERELDVLRIQADATYGLDTEYVGHPFLQFVREQDESTTDDDDSADDVERWYDGMPRSQLALDTKGRVFTRRPAPDVVRIACLGGSTTERGFPEAMDAYLETVTAAPNARFEVMNFGESYYCTAHSLANLVFRVIDVEPDYVVIHHAWNEFVVRSAGEAFESDYSHAFKSYEPPQTADYAAIRCSVVYRLLRERIMRFFPTAGSPVLITRTEPIHDVDVPRELEPYRRNVETVIDVCLGQGIRPVLTTQPRKVSGEEDHGAVGAHIDQCNEVMRGIAAAHRGIALFVDLDAEMTSRMDHVFEDLAHVNTEGRRYKAESIADVIVDDVIDRRGEDAPSRDGPSEDDFTPGDPRRGESMDRRRGISPPARGCPSAS